MLRGWWNFEVVQFPAAQHWSMIVFCSVFFFLQSRGQKKSESDYISFKLQTKFKGWMKNICQFKKKTQKAQKDRA